MNNQENSLTLKEWNKIGQKIWNYGIVKKPPLGIMPKYIHDEKRRDNLINAVNRYEEVNLPIPEKWITEIEDLTDTIVLLAGVVVNTNEMAKDLNRQLWLSQYRASRELMLIELNKCINR